MIKLSQIIIFALSILSVRAQQVFEITFMHDGFVVFGTFTTPEGEGPFPTVIVNPGTGANDRDGTIPMEGANVICLYPGLLGETLTPYKGLSDALVDSGFAVLRYDKLEFTYPLTLPPITFYRLWLPVTSAIDYVKTRSDVDTERIILLGHSEGSSLIPFIAKDRDDIRALISLAGPRTPFDSLLAYQIVHITQLCGGNILQAQAQANQILNYFNVIRTNTWHGGTPPLFGVPASAWYDYVVATDAVAVHYNVNALPTLFIGLELDINVPPSELDRFRDDITITEDFWSLPGLNHFLTPNDDPNVSAALTDTVIYWLRRHVLTSNVHGKEASNIAIQVYPNPFSSDLTIVLSAISDTQVSYQMRNTIGEVVWRMQNAGPLVTTPDLSKLAPGLYVLEIHTQHGVTVSKVLKL